MSTYDSIEQVQSPMVRRLYAWWTDHGRNDPPDRSDFNPHDFKDLLPNILITDVEETPFRIRYRLAGTRIIDATGFNIVGCYLDELLPTEPEAPWQELYYASYRTRRPVIGTSTCTTTSGDPFTHEYGLFPIRKAGASIAQFLAIEDYKDLMSRLTDLVQWQARPLPVD